MDDALFVRGLQGRGDLARDDQRIGDRKSGTFRHVARDVRQGFRQRVAVHELENQEADTVGFLETVDGTDIRMI